MYKSTVVSVGEEAYFEDYPMLILFNPTVPDELREVCIVHQVEETVAQEVLFAEGTIFFGDTKLTIKEVGNLANENFYTLGHITLQFQSDEAPELLPGSILLKESNIPKLVAGDRIHITK